MSEYENRAKKLKLIIEAKSIADQMESKKSNFSSINPSNGAVVRGGSGSSNAKGEVKKIVIKNFRSKFWISVPFIDSRCVKKTFNDTTVLMKQ